MIGLVYRPYITIQDPGNTVDVREFTVSKPVVNITMAIDHCFACLRLSILLF